MAIYGIWGAGQTGKTTLALNMATLANEQGLSVCLISPLEYSELAVLLNVSIPYEKSLPMAIGGKKNLQEVAFQVDELLYVLAAPSQSFAYEENFSASQIGRMLAEADELFDMVLVDCPSPTCHLVAACSLKVAKTVFICVGGNYGTVLWNKVNKNLVALIANKVKYVGVRTQANFNYKSLYDFVEVEVDYQLPYVADALNFKAMEKAIYKIGGKESEAYKNVLLTMLEVE